MTLPLAVRINASIPFPAQTLGSGPINIAKKNGVYTIALSVDNLVDTAPPTGNLATDFITYYDAVQKIWLKASLAELQVSPNQNFKNIVGRNGGVEVWQRLAVGSFAISVAASAVAYTADGWYLATGANQAATVTQVAGLANGSRAAAQVQRTAGQTGTGAMVFAFPLDSDELAKLRGSAALLSFTASAGANWSPASGTLTWKLYCGTGAVAKRNATPYTGETNPISGAVNLTPGGAAARVVSQVSAAIGSAITQAELQFTWTPTGTAGANDLFSMDDVQLEVAPTGIAALNPLFERSDFIWDLRRCQRFLPVWNMNGAAAGPVVGIGGSFSTTQVFVNFTFLEQSRAPITGIVVSAPAHFIAFDPSAATNRALTAIAFNTGGTYSASMVLTAGAASFVAGQWSTLQGNVAGALIVFTGAEI